MRTFNVTDLRQTNKYAEYIKILGWRVDKFQNINIYTKKLLFWKYVKIQRPVSIDFNEFLKYIKSGYRFSSVYIEPSTYIQYRKLLDIGFVKNSSPFLPSKTIRVDLSKNEDQLLKEMHPKTRYNIKIALRNKLKTSITNDIEYFADFWQKCAINRGMFLIEKNKIKVIYKVFGKDAMIHTILNKKGNWLAAVLRISSKNISYYLYAASSYEGKKYYAPTLAAWSAIKFSKKEGRKIFDFEGVYDERFPLNAWKGFSRFKKGFGGKEEIFPGCLSKVII